MASSSNEVADEFEERMMVLELKGVFDADAVKAALSEGETRIVRIDSETPVVQIGGGLYSCRWEQPIGTDLIFSENTAEHSLQLNGVSDRRLVAEKAFIIPRSGEPEKGSTSHK